MQLSILALGLALLLFVHDAQAQISSAPSCAAGCITSAAQAAGCTTVSNTTCLCGTSFRSATERCISQGVCNPSDQSVLDSLLNVLCSGVISTGGPSSGTGPTASGSGASNGTTVTIHVSNTPRPPITTGTFTIISSLLPPISSGPATDTTSAASSPGSTPDSATTPTSTSTLIPTSPPSLSLTLPIPTTPNGPTTSVVFSTVGGGAPTSSVAPTGNSANRLGLSGGLVLCMIFSILLVHNR